MFLDDYSKQQHIQIWKQNPRICRLSHSFNDPHWSYQYHIHNNETELTYISRGSGTYFINNNRYELQKGDILIIEKGTIHSLISNEDDPLSCYTCAITDFKLNNSSEGFILPSNAKPILQAKEHENFIHHLFIEMTLIREQDIENTLPLLDSLATALATLYHTIFSRNLEKERQKESSFARDVLIYINENYTSSISLKKLSDEFHISADHISHEFSKVYGISPINYVIERRISEAKWMLINTENSLISISKKVGYENTSHFTKLFLKRVKKTPLEFREKYQ